MMIILHLLRDQRPTSHHSHQSWNPPMLGNRKPSQSSGGGETHLPLSIWARLMPGASVDMGHAPGLLKLEKVARLRVNLQTSGLCNLSHLPLWPALNACGSSTFSRLSPGCPSASRPGSCCSPSHAPRATRTTPHPAQPHPLG
uniref:Uncharacterized protein n=1 Tax=Pongo abelii TaxID=9601 RepID=A0A8I5UTR6_PONAB